MTLLDWLWKYSGGNKGLVANITTTDRVVCYTTRQPKNTVKLLDCFHATTMMILSPLPMILTTTATTVKMLRLWTRRLNALPRLRLAFALALGMTFPLLI